MEFNRFLKNYIEYPLLRDSDEVYIPVTLKGYFQSPSADTSNLDYLRQDNVVCAILPFLEDVILELDNTYKLIYSIEDEITRMYYLDNLKPYTQDVTTFIVRTIEWVNTYDRTQ